MQYNITVTGHSACYICSLNWKGKQMSPSYLDQLQYWSSAKGLAEFRPIWQLCLLFNSEQEFFKWSESLSLQTRTQYWPTLDHFSDCINAAKKIPGGAYAKKSWMKV